jgi:hypothetical protein
MDANTDAKNIHKAIAGLGTDESELINIIGRRPNWHLQVKNFYIYILFFSI